MSTGECARRRCGVARRANARGVPINGGDRGGPCAGCGAAAQCVPPPADRRPHWWQLGCPVTSPSVGSRSRLAANRACARASPPGCSARPPWCRPPPPPLAATPAPSKRRWPPAFSPPSHTHTHTHSLPTPTPDRDDALEAAVAAVTLPDDSDERASRSPSVPPPPLLPPLTAVLSGAGGGPGAGAPTSATAAVARILAMPLPGAPAPSPAARAAGRVAPPARRHPATPLLAHQRAPPAQPPHARGC